MFKLILVALTLIVPGQTLIEDEPEPPTSKPQFGEFDGYLKDIVYVEEEVEVDYRWEYIPKVTKDFKSYMDYGAITNKSSIQWQLQQKAYTEEGYRKLEGRIMVAMAAYPVGTELDLYLSSGEILEVVIGDIKAGTSLQHPDGSVVEFIVDTGSMRSDVRRDGSFHNIHKGIIEKVKIYE